MARSLWTPPWRCPFLGWKGRLAWFIFFTVPIINGGLKPGFAGMGYKKPGCRATAAVAALGGLFVRGATQAGREQTQPTRSQLHPASPVLPPWAYARVVVTGWIFLLTKRDENNGKFWVTWGWQVCVITDTFNRNELAPKNVLKSIFSYITFPSTSL